MHTLDKTGTQTCKSEVLMFNVNVYIRAWLQKQSQFCNIYKDEHSFWKKVISFVSVCYRNMLSAEWKYSRQHKHSLCFEQQDMMTSQKYDKESNSQVLRVAEVYQLRKKGRLMVWWHKCVRGWDLSAKGIPIKRLGCYYSFGRWEIKSNVVHCEGGVVGDQKKLTKASLKSEGCYVAAIRKNKGYFDGINKDTWATFQSQAQEWPPW